MNEKQIEAFKNYMKREGKRDKTIREYTISSRKLFQYLDEKNLGYQEIRSKEALDFQLWVIELGKSKQGGYVSGTVICIMKAALMFFDYLKSEDLVYENPFREIPWIKEKRGIPKDVPKEKEIQKLLKSLTHFNKEESLQRRILFYRLHLMAELLYSTGMRAGEAANIELKDIDFEKGVIHLPETKDKKERYVFLNQYTLDIIKIYIQELRPLLLDKRGNSKKLFGCNGAVLKNKLSRYFKDFAGLRLTSRSFRHTFGYHMLRAGCNIRYIQEFLGHRRLVSTERYTKVEKEDLKEVIDKYHPRKWRVT